ncbi:hypothetical protein PIB30_001623 [Stylosanthes scabra]|uniref:Uncharacterized protein n=1 Tax=Stylosanthes scabra TaxID=79078 RepID=A0ABU6S3Z9_9FABA|nr:hypothetical protein [Stylosanthes scabra]
MPNPNLIVSTLYLDGELKRDVDGIGFACPNPILCYINRVDTLDELKNFILRTMRAVGWKHVRRIAYKFLDILPPLEYKFELFWLESDVHVRTMFDMHHRYDPSQVMELLIEIQNVNHSEAGPFSSRAGPVDAIAAPPLQIATPVVTTKNAPITGRFFEDFGRF